VFHIHINEITLSLLIEEIFERVTKLEKWE
jgi:hypothetical protein